MKTYYPIHTLLVFFICTVTFASTSKDFLAVGKRTRTFTTAPAVATHSGAAKTSAARGVVSTKGGNSGGEIITTKGKLVLVENGADVGVKFINTTQELTTVVVSTMPTLTRVTSSGITVTKNVDKTVTILGKYNDDIRYILDDLEYPKTLNFEAKKIGYNLLNAPDELYLTAEQFWLQFNKSFLDKAILRGDEIVLASNPNDAALNVFDDAGSIVGRSGFGREYDHLQANGYVFDDVSKKMVKSVDDLASLFPKLAGKLDDWAHLGLNFNKIDDIVKVTAQNGDEIARVVKNGSDEILEIFDDFFKATGNNTTPITGMTVKTSSRESIIGGGFVKNADGTVGFIEDVSSYGSQIVQNTIKNRGDLRGTIQGILLGQEAHHYIPIQLAKDNNVVQKAIEGGFDFNKGAVNGIALDKYVATTGLGRHGPHPRYTNQISDYLDNVWAPANPN